MTCPCTRCVGPPVGVCVRGNSYLPYRTAGSTIYGQTAVMHGGDVQPAYTMERSRDSVYHRDWLHTQHSQNTVSRVAFPESLLYNHIHVLSSPITSSDEVKFSRSNFIKKCQSRGIKAIHHSPVHYTPLLVLLPRLLHIDTEYLFDPGVDPGRLASSRHRLT